MLPVRVLIFAAVLLLVASLVPALAPHAQAADPPVIPFNTLPRTTQEHILASAWWPTKPLAAPSGFAGAKSCAGCHTEIADAQQHSQMALTLEPAAGSTVLAAHVRDMYRSGPYTTTLVRAAGGFQIAVRDGQATETAPLEWAFGSGDIGQSYLWQQRDGSFAEARFNYFASIHTFGDTPGRLQSAPTSLPMAVGRRIEGFEAQTCFRCHTTAMSSALPVNMATVVPGIHCEACHGPGAAHIAAANAADARPASEASRPWNRAILNPAHLSPTDAVDLCGACHGTPADVRLQGGAGRQTVRSAGYRLEGSRCWLGAAPANAGDSRLVCSSCHDPHAPLDRVADHYDHVCLQCHADRAGAVTSAGMPHVGAIPVEASGLPATHPTQRACPVATHGCSSCHMPKYELPEMHAKFTDHRIRIARDGEPFPDAAPSQVAAAH